MLLLIPNANYWSTCCLWVCVCPDPLVSLCYPPWHLKETNAKLNKLQIYMEAGKAALEGAGVSESGLAAVHKRPAANGQAGAQLVARRQLVRQVFACCPVEISGERMFALWSMLVSLLEQHQANVHLMSIYVSIVCESKLSSKLALDSTDCKSAILFHFISSDIS